jgi:hypothetical protein
MTIDNETAVDRSLAERRRYKRERVNLMGRHFEPDANHEADCKIADISPGGARILSNVVPPYGTQVVVYIDGFGRFEGSVARVERDGFAIEFSCSEHKRERIVKQLTNYVSGVPLEKTTLRRHERTPKERMVSFTRANGDVVNCKLLDYSLSGVFLATEIRPPVGEFVLISQVPGRIARHHQTGIAIEFTSQDKVAVESGRPKLFASR